MTTPQDQDPFDEEIDDLGGFVDDPNASNFLESRWWRWVGIGVAAVIATAFMLPLLAPFFSGGGGARSPSQPVAGSAAVPDFLLETADGTTVRLSDETRRNDAVVLVFYRGYF